MDQGVAVAVGLGRGEPWLAVGADLGATGTLEHLLPMNIAFPFGQRQLRLLQASATINGQATRSNSWR